MSEEHIQKKQNEKSRVARSEEEVLARWNDRRIFQKTLDKDAPKGEYVFYDGPPFATGLPHYGHILASVIKDMVPRYKTMQGYRVERRWGWDCHGLPVENIVEKDLHVSGKKQIETLGVEKFNEYARSKVLGYAHEWKRTVERIGRWVDFDGSYKTLDNTYIESVWWALKELHKKELLYESTRVLPYCPRCETPIANSEIAMDNSYKDIKDISVYVLFKRVSKPDSFFLAWTTTPWTLPGNFALAVHPHMEYVEVSVQKEGGERMRVVLAKDRVQEVLGKRGYAIEVITSYTGKDLIGEAYEAIFPYFKDSAAIDMQKAWHVYGGEFVTKETGTGIVHIAPGYGEDDMQLAKKEHIPWKHHVTPEGAFDAIVSHFGGKKVKPKPEKAGEHQVTDIEVIKHLAHAGHLFAKETIQHAYPHCYRCETPLFYYAIPAWFIRIQDAKKDILENNQTIHWIPGHLQNGRFKHSAENAPDWNFSRNRFWASPLPIWKSEETGEVEFIGSIHELQSKLDRNNTFTIIRHGEAENNVRGILNSDSMQPYHLTDTGKEQVEKAARELKHVRITKIYVSDLVRTQETARIIQKALGVDDDAVIVDPRLREIDFGSLNGESSETYHSLHATYEEGFRERIPGGESLTDVRMRLGNFLFDIYEKHANEHILIVGHESPLWLLEAIAAGLDEQQTILLREAKRTDYIRNGEFRSLRFVPYPHNAKYELDVHRPYIDRITYVSQSGHVMKRIPEVIDCWFESGSMPFAAMHYPFEHTREFEKRFPADFVAEYIAQTRTWFYYMHVLGTMLFGKAPFKHVVTTGTILAEDGQKMSKSKGNFPDPWILFDTYGVDALRYYLLSTPLMKAEDLHFSEKDVDTVYKKIILRLENVLSFYEMFAKNNVGDAVALRCDSKHVLDQWIVSRVNETLVSFTDSIESYQIDAAIRPIDLFVDDLSTWYLRRSRERLKQEDVHVAATTLRSVLYLFSHIIAPIMPFIAERIFDTVREKGDAESVHLQPWPHAIQHTHVRAPHVLIEEMAQLRSLLSSVLEARTRHGIKVRQPLQALLVPPHSLAARPEYGDIVRDELNVKEVRVDEKIQADFELDIHITEALKLEGRYNDLVRHIQDMRKEAKLTPGEEIVLTLPDTEETRSILTEWESDLRALVSAKRIDVDSVEHPRIHVL